MNKAMQEIISDGYKLPQEVEAWEAEISARLLGNAWRNTIIETTEEYLKTLRKRKAVTPTEAASGLLEATTNILMEYNAEVPEEKKWPVPEELYPWQIGMLVMEFHKVVFSSKEVLAYQVDGPDKGIYTHCNLMDITRSFIPETVSDREKAADDASRWLVDLGVHYKRKKKKKYSEITLEFIAVNNGIFDPSKKVLKPFSSKYIFFEKCRVDYVMGADGPVMRNLDDGTEQDVDSWLAGLSSESMSRLSNSIKAIFFHLF